MNHLCYIEKQAKQADFGLLQKTKTKKNTDNLQHKDDSQQVLLWYNRHKIELENHSSL